MTTKISGDNISSIGNTGLNWQAVTVADGSTTVNATSGNGYLLDTNAGVIEVFLPTTPTRGDTVVLADYSGTFATNRVIINTGGVLIDSTVGPDFQLTTNNTIAEFVYIDSAKGWLVKFNQAAGTTSSALTGYSSSYDIPDPFIQATGGTVTTSGDYKIHTFTGDGCFVVTGVALGTSSHPSIVDYMVVAGGGGGGGSVASGDSAGGGGAGGFRESKASASPTHTASPHTASPLAATAGITATITTYPITVGAGGTGGVQPGQGGSGSNSVFSTITSAGGGGGGTFPGPPYGGIDGGSGGGGAGGNPNTPGSANGGLGNTPPTSPPQGNSGGAASDGPLNVWGGGGGGATQAGTSACAYGTLGDGGDGAQTSISGSATYYAGGGGGGATPARPTVGGAPGGLGGGGSGVSGIAGTTNTGGGGGGGDNDNGGAGGSGIVILRYKFQ